MLDFWAEYFGNHLGFMDAHPKYKICLLHNYYQERGGEDHSFEAEKLLLTTMGHEVNIYTRHNDEINSYSSLEKVKLAYRTIWASDSYAKTRSLLELERPDVCHFNNTFPLISPSVYDACRDVGIPVIQNLRNYRLICPNGYLFRDHRICEDCIGRQIPWPGIVHACYRDSYLQSAVVAAMLSYHNIRHTWVNKVDTFIALTNFSRNKFIEGGLPARKIVVKPNFTFDHGLGEGVGNHAIFIGRLIDGKGLFELLNAWSECANIPLKIVGDGPLRNELISMLSKKNFRNVDLCGRLSSEQTLAMLKGARFLVYSSTWYENFPRVLIESFSCGRPVIASNLGASSELIEHGRTGFQYRSGDSKDLASNVLWLWDHPEESRRMGKEARQEFEEKYTPKHNYRLLMDIYESTISHYNR